MIDIIFYLLIGFWIGFFFSFTKKGKEISALLIAHVDMALPPKKEEM